MSNDNLDDEIGETNLPIFLVVVGSALMLALAVTLVGNYIQSLWL